MNTSSTPTLPTSSEKSFVEKLIPIYTEIDTLLEDAKAVLDTAKEQGYNTAMLAKVAKAKAGTNIGKLEDQTNALLDLIDKIQ